MESELEATDQTLLLPDPRNARLTNMLTNELTCFFGTIYKRWNYKKTHYKKFENSLNDDRPSVWITTVPFYKGV